MIAFVRGRVESIEEEGLIVDLGGIALQVLTPLSMMEPRPVIGEEILLHTHMHVREDAWQLFGFTDKEQLRIFRMLQSVSGVGAKTALAIVDQLSIKRFSAAIASQDIKALTTVSGIGKKTAERILLEMKDKFPQLVGGDAALGLPADDIALNEDLLLALKQLGYTATEARAFGLKAQSNIGVDAKAEELLREALKIAMKS